MRIWEMSLDEGGGPQAGRGIRIRVAPCPKGWDATVTVRGEPFCKIPPSESAERAMSRANLMFSPMVQRTWKEREI